MSLVSSLASPASKLNEYERFAYDHFVHRLAEPLEQISPTKGWVRLALQLSSEAAPILHATVAAATADQAQLGIEHITLSRAVDHVEQSAVVRQYCKAMAMLRKYIDKAVGSNAALEPVLLASLLFVCIEVVQGNGDIATSHLRFARAIMQEFAISEDPTQHKQRFILSPQSPTATQNLSDAIDKLEQASLGIAGQAKWLYLQPKELHHPVADAGSMPLSFASMDQAQAHLKKLITAGEIYRAELLRVAEAYVATMPHTSLNRDARYCLARCLSRILDISCCSQLTRRMEELLDRHSAWLSAFTALEIRNEGATPPRLLLLTRIQHWFSYFTLSTCRDTTEQVTDRFTNDFADILDLAERYLNSFIDMPQALPMFQTPAGFERQRTFSLECGMLPAVYLICYKCRSQQIRHRAINLLRQADRREGLYSSGVLCAYAKAIVGLEEQRSAAVAPKQSGDRMAAPEALPEDEMRFSDVVIAGDQEQPGRIRVVCGRLVLGQFDGGAEAELLDYRGGGYPISLQLVGREAVRC